MNLTRWQKYESKWIVANQMGFNPLLLTEWNVENINMKNTDLVLDLACGKCASSIFIAKEYGCKVIAGDLWIDQNSNYREILSHNLENAIMPLKLEARNIPFPAEYFDLIICTDSFIYFGTDDLFIPYIQQFIKKGGYLAFTVPGFPNEEPDELPEHLKPIWADECWTWHNKDWWAHHINKFGYFNIKESECLTNGINEWINWKKLRKDLGDQSDSIVKDIKVMEEDKGRYMNFLKIVAQKK